MKVTDNRSKSTLAEGKVIDIYRWGGGITLTLDTGYIVFLEKQEVAKILEPADAKAER